MVINEIFYNPTDADDGDAEFFELHNPGDTSVDLTGWTSRTPMARTGRCRVVGCGRVRDCDPDGYDALTRWGVSPIATFPNGLSGGGDTIIIKNDVGAVIDQVDYDDTAPWPGEADGDGPSAELIDALSDNSVGTAWAASVGGPTPAAVNSVTLSPPADPITNVVATPVLA